MYGTKAASGESTPVGHPYLCSVHFLGFQVDGHVRVDGFRADSLYVDDGGNSAGRIAIGILVHVGTARCHSESRNHVAGSLEC